MKIIFKDWKSLLRIIKLTLIISCRGFKAGIGTIVFTLRSVNSILKYSNSNHPILNLKINPLKLESNTLFILGSGPSINKIDDKEWEIIKSKDTWGFNFWFCHRFIPKTYFLQSPISTLNNAEHLSALDKLMNEILIEKKKAYKRTTFLLRGDGVNNHTFHKSMIGKTVLENDFNYYFLPELIISSKSKIKPHRLVKAIFLSGFFSNKNSLSPIPKLGSTITEMISLALMVGYKRIILCGIDMNDGGHFYDSNKYYKKYKYLKVLSDLNNDKIIHEHMDKSARKNTVKDLILELNKLAEKKFNAEIFVSSSTSSLYPEIKKYKFQELNNTN